VFQTLRRLLKAVPLIKPVVQSPMELGKEWKQWEQVQPHGRAGCPNCYGTKFYSGPEGPGAQNIECVSCGCRWNVSFAGIPWEYIGRNDAFRSMVRRARLQAGISEEEA